MTSAMPPALRDGLDLVVADITDLPGNVRSIVLRRPDGGELPGYVAGSHLIVDCGGTANAYSLTGDGIFPSSYAISVRRDDGGRGGSRRMHALVVGERVRVSRPRSAFPPVADARRHVLVAGGIGVTPILSHARAAAAWGRPAVVVYAHRVGAGAHREDLSALTDAGITVVLCEGRHELSAALADLLADSPLGTHLYTCGPEEFMASVLGAARVQGWPEGRLHSEAFGVAALDPGAPFTAVLAGGAERITVPAGTSLLEALEATGRRIPNMCRQGVCGECVLPVSRGRPLHRDHYLSEEERAEGRAIMCCVSRSLDPELELSL